MDQRLDREQLTRRIAEVREANRIALERTAYSRRDLEFAARMSDLVIERAMRRLRRYR